MSFRLDLVECNSVDEIKRKLSATLDGYAELFPQSKNASILLKPNLNANMNALTGNTTDLRLLAAVIEHLKDRGYGNITIGEGTNSGYYRSNISVISRLLVDKLASYYGIKVIDLNYSEIHQIEFADGVKAGVAKDVVDADFLINIPKLKTHFEAGMSVCLKNLMGCLVGQENKKKTHKNLSRNILHINEHIRPDIHIVDGLIAMEGLGPTRGTPVKMNLLIAGTDPYLIDLVCAKIARFDYRDVKTLNVAESLGRLTSEHHSYADAVDLSKFKREFAPPKAGPIATFIHHPKRQKYFLAIRNTRLFTALCSTKLAGKILYATGLRQDVFIDDEMNCEKLSVNMNKCTECKKCKEYCPVSINLPVDLEKTDNGCIHCLYCYLVCPETAIEFKGELGFMNEQLRQYDHIVRKIT